MKFNNKLKSIIYYLKLKKLREFDSRFYLVKNKNLVHYY